MGVLIFAKSILNSAFRLPVLERNYTSSSDRLVRESNLLVFFKIHEKSI